MGSTFVSWPALVAIAIFATACAGTDVDAPAEEPEAAGQSADESAVEEAPARGAEPDLVRLMRGTVIYDEEIPTFRPCGTDEVLTLANDAGRIAELHAELTTGLAPGAELFAVLEGSRAAAPAEGAGTGASGAMRLESVLYFGFEGPSCESVWNFRYQARGNEPFWMVRVDDNELRLTRPAQEDLLWPAFETIERDEGPTYRAPQTEELPDAVLTLRVGDCRDSMSGAYFGYSATFAFGEQSFSGCALVGDR